MKYLSITALSFILPLAAQALEIKGYTPDETVVYKTVGDKELKLHVFYPEDHKPSDKRAAVVFFFGGGWVSGSPTQFHPQCEHLASRGMVAISADYRVRSRDKTTPKECVKDGKSAIRWIRKHADQLGIDPSRIAAGGGSAGGHVAAAAGTLEGFEESGEDLSISSQPNALVLYNPVFDNGPEGYGYKRVKDYWEAISPMHNIDENTPPTLVILGTKDHYIPVQTAKEYQRRMEAHGLRCDLDIYKDQKHGFFNPGRAGFFDKTMQAVDEFLVSLDYLKAPE